MQIMEQSSSTLCCGLDSDFKCNHVRSGVGMYLGIDCGTQGTKALVVDRDGTAFGRGYAPHELTESSSGAREQQPVWWIKALRIAVKQALSSMPAGSVRALSVSGQQHGLVVLDENLEVIRPAKLWNDTETVAQNEELIERLGGREAFFERFGIVPLTGYTVSKLLWLAENEPDNFARIRHILLPHEYLNFWLTGQLRAEYGDASGTAFFDPRTRTWAPDVLAAIDGGSGLLERALPALVSAEEIVGTLRLEVAAELGLHASTLVASGGGDNMMGAIGTGNIQEGIVTMSLGTSSTVYSFRNAPSSDVTGCVAPFCSSSGGWLPLVCTMNATNIVTQTVNLLGKTVADIDAALKTTSPGAGGITFLPFLNGERTPNLPTATGSLLGVTSTNWSAENLIRAAVEGVSFGMLAGLDLILNGAHGERIRLIGGGARSAAWRQLLADATGTIIEVPLEEEAGCLGAAMQAMYAEGHALSKKEGFTEIASRCVQLDGAKTMYPDTIQRSAYLLARRRYKDYLKLLHPETQSSVSQNLNSVPASAVTANR
jgi:xylulokinase